MTISFTSISSTTATQSLLSTKSTAASTATASTSSTDSGDHVKKSKMGDLMQQLQDLEKTDPDKAKAVLSKISEQLSAKADATGDSKMKDLAQKFSDAAESGDLSSLKPPKHPDGPPPMKMDAYQRQSGTNPMETIESVISSALAS